MKPAAHPSPPDLLAWMDGELPLWKRWKVARHLRNCWQCRNRTADLTDTIRVAATVISNSVKPDRTRTASSKWRLHDEIRAFEAASVIEAPRGKYRLALGAAAMLAVAVVFAMPVLLRREQRVPAPVVPVPARKPLDVRSAPPPPPQRAAPVTPASAPIVILREAVDSRDLDIVEVEVWSLLHRARLCLGGGIHLRRTAERVEVSGLLPTEDRKNQLLALLLGVGRQDLLRVDLRNVAEVPPAGGTPVEHRGTVPSEAPAEAWLRAHMRVGDAATQREMFDVMNAIVTNAGGLMAESWALRRLAERYPVEAERDLPETARIELRVIAEDHAMAADSSIAAIAELLRPLGISLPPRRPSMSGAGDWQSAALALQGRAAQDAGVLLSLFTAGSDRRPTGAEAESEVVRAAAGLAHMREIAAQGREASSPSVRGAVNRP